MFIIENKVALITGGPGGIGLEYARALLKKNLKGVTLVGIHEMKGLAALAKLEQEFGKNRAIYVRADVCNKTEFENAFEITVQTFKQLDIVINNAGIIQEIEWEKCISVNLMGTILGSTLAIQKYLPKYRCGEEGVILNTSSLAGLTSVEAIPVYTSSKQGIVGYGTSIGGPLQYNVTKVRVLTICPNLTDTPLLQTTPKQLSEVQQTEWTRLLNIIPIQRADKVAEHAVAIIENGLNGSAWLVSDNKLKELTLPSIDDILKE